MYQKHFKQPTKSEYNLPRQLHSSGLNLRKSSDKFAKMFEQIYTVAFVAIVKTLQCREEVVAG